MPVNGKFKPARDNQLSPILSRLFASRSGAKRLSPWTIAIETKRNRGNPTTIAQTDKEKLSSVASSKISATMIIAIIKTTRKTVIQLLINNQISLASLLSSGASILSRNVCAISLPYSGPA